MVRKSLSPQLPHKRKKPLHHLPEETLLEWRREMVSPGMWVLGPGEETGLFSGRVRIGRPPLVWSWEMKGFVTGAVLAGRAEDLQAVLETAVLEVVVHGMVVLGMVVAQVLVLGMSVFQFVLV